jgi:hypothetical protein
VGEKEDAFKDLESETLEIDGPTAVALVMALAELILAIATPEEAKAAIDRMAALRVSALADEAERRKFSS